MQEQYYEGASTVYGPYTLDAYISKFKEMAMDMATVSHNICPVQSRFNMKCDLAGKEYYPWTQSSKSPESTDITPHTSCL